MPGPSLYADVSSQCSQQVSKQQFVKQLSKSSCWNCQRGLIRTAVKASSSPATSGLSTADVKKAKLESMAGSKHGLDK